MPPTARNASGLARHLGIDRTTCQRAVFAVSRPYPGTELFSRLPGVKALARIAEAAAAAEPAPARATLDALEAAIDQFQELVATTGGSLARLTRRLERSTAVGHAATHTPRSQAESSALGARMRLYEAAAELTGRSSACWVAVYAYRPTSDGQTVEVFRAHGLVGHVARADAVPLTVHNFTRKTDEGESPQPERFASLENVEVEGRNGTVVLEEFSSDPVPLVTSRQPDEFLVQSIDERAPAIGHPVDLMLSARTSMPHPVLQSPPIEEAWALLNFPCRHLLFDIWMHRDLACSCIPSLDTHLWGPDFSTQLGDRWRTRFADSPPLQLLGPGLRRSSPPAYPRLGELTQHLFSRVSLEPDEFVGFRCDVEYPLWRAGYCVSFDFTRPGRAEGGDDPQT
jgi:hypothetical protein